MKKFIIIAFVVALTSTSASAQLSIFHIDWNVAFPTGDLKENYISAESYRGVRIGGRKFIYDYLSVGGQGGWQVYYDTFTGVQTVDESTEIYAKQFRYINAYPLMANIHYYLGDDGGLRPYIGTNVGMTFIHQRTEFGLWSVSETTTHFSLAPEIGALIPIGVAGGGLNIGAKYEHAFKTNNLDMNVQSISFFLGFIFAN